MKALFWIITFVTCGCMSASSQTNHYTLADSVELTVVKPAKPSNETKQERKAREKRQKEQVDSLAHDLSSQAVEQGYFALMADRMTIGRSGYTVNSVQSNANFVLMQGENAMVQLAFNNGMLGQNGLGGITLPGHISNKRITTDKKGNVYLSFIIVGSQFNADVAITLSANSDYATAIITPTFGSDRLTVYGRLLPYRNSRIDFNQ